MAEWAKRDHLGAKNHTSDLTKETKIYTFGNGLVRAYFDKSIGHDWPSTNRNSDNERDGHEVASYNASSIIMEFFAKYRLPAA